MPQKPSPPSAPPARTLAPHVQAAQAAVQAKVARPGATVQAFQVSTAHLGSEARQIRLAAGGQSVGSVEVRVADRDAVKVMNLEVAPDHRKQGAGIQLMKAAANEGLRMGRSRITLESQDNGTGKLTRWYERMGFQPRGRSDRGMVILEAPAAAIRSRS